MKKSINNIGIKVTNNDGKEIIKMLEDCGAVNSHGMSGKEDNESIYFNTTYGLCPGIGASKTIERAKKVYGITKIFNSLSEFVAWWCEPIKKKDLTKIAILATPKTAKTIINWFECIGIHKGGCFGNISANLYYFTHPVYCDLLTTSITAPINRGVEYKIFKSLSAAKAWYNRPVIEFKPKFDTKLRELGVRTEFIKEFLRMPKACGCTFCLTDIDKRIEECNKSMSFIHFIYTAINPECCIKGITFWVNIAEGYNPITEVRLQESEVIHE